VVYSRNAGLLASSEVERILNLLEKLGFTLFADELLNANNSDQPAILSGIEEFREHLGGELSVTLLTKIGRSMEVHEMDSRLVTAAIHELRDRRRMHNK
jgi:3-dehydroquinate synthase